ncbi:hypothetical protein AAT19DRAFT_9994, partial [Rhodotorula toruloides]
EHLPRCARVSLPSQIVVDVHSSWEASQRLSKLFPPANNANEATAPLLSPPLLSSSPHLAKDGTLLLPPVRASQAPPPPRRRHWPSSASPPPHAPHRLRPPSPARSSFRSRYWIRTRAGQDGCRDAGRWTGDGKEEEEQVVKRAKGL